MKKKYYEAFKTENGFKGRIYDYDERDKLRVIWVSPIEYQTYQLAIDAAITWVDEHDLEAELG